MTSTQHDWCNEHKYKRLTEWLTRYSILPQADMEAHLCNYVISSGKEDLGGNGQEKKKCRSNDKKRGNISANITVNRWKKIHTCEVSRVLKNKKKKKIEQRLLFASYASARNAEKLSAQPSSP